MPCGFDGSFCGLAEQQLELGEDLLDRVQVGGVRRQVQQLGPDGADGAANGGTFVTAQVVHDDNVTRGERWYEELLDPGGEVEAIDRPVEHAWRIDPIMPERGQEGQCPPMAEGGAGNQLLATRCPSADRRHVGLGPGLIDEDETPGIKPPLVFLPLLAPACDLGPQLFDGEQCFF